MTGLSDAERDALREERDFLLGSLRDLDNEREAGDVDSDDYANLRSGYIARAAAIERELQRGEVELERAPRRWRKRVLTAVVVVAVGIGAGMFVARQSGERLPGQSASGGLDQSTASMLAQARMADMSSPAEALSLYNAVLKLEPDNVEALTYRAWLLSRIAPTSTELTDAQKRQVTLQVLADLVRSTKLDPTFSDAFCFLGIVEFRQLGSAKAAKEPLETCMAMNPPHVVAGRVKAILDEVNAALK